jgi:hypothetical protein
MQHKVISRSDYDTLVYNHPITLLKAVKEHSLNYQKTRYKLSIISVAFRSVFTAKQREGENLQDYTRRFKTSTEILESHLGGPIVLSKYVATMNGYDNTNADKTALLTRTASEQLYAFMYLENSDQHKYGSIMGNLNLQKSLGNDQYPRSIVETNNVSSNHKFDPFQSKKQDYKKPGQKQKEEAEEENTTLLSFAQLEGKCYCCGKAGHKSPACRNKDKTPREEWAINKAQLAQAKIPSSASTVSLNASKIISEKEEVEIGWAGLHCSFTQAVSLKEMILLDSDSTDTVFCNPKYVTNIRDSDKSLSISTNGGLINSNQKCDIPHIPDVWYNEDSITNIISLAEINKQFRVPYNLEQELALLVHTPGKIVKFKQWPNGLYAMDPNDKASYKLTGTNEAIPHQFLNSQENNLTFLSAR